MYEDGARAEYLDRREAEREREMEKKMCRADEDSNRFGIAAVSARSGAGYTAEKPETGIPKEHKESLRGETHQGDSKCISWLIWLKLRKEQDFPIGASDK